MKPGQRGGFLMGLVAGLLVGLALALGVALYITKAPIPFINKVPQRTPEQDTAEAERNRSWDPNAPLAGKPVRPAGAASGGAAHDGVVAVAGDQGAQKRVRIREIGDPRGHGDRVVAALLVGEQGLLLQGRDRDVHAQLLLPFGLDRLQDAQR